MCNFYTQCSLFSNFLAFSFFLFLLEINLGCFRSIIQLFSTSGNSASPCIADLNSCNIRTNIYIGLHIYVYTHRPPITSHILTFFLIGERARTKEAPPALSLTFCLCSAVSFAGGRKTKGAELEEVRILP